MYRTLFFLALSFFAWFSTTAQEVNSILLRKAETHFDNGEWKEAAAMFNVLINESPSVLGLYPYAVASNDLGGDRDGVMAAVVLSEKSGIPLDSLFTRTKKFCTLFGDNGIYERLLLSIKGEQPWFKRIVNRYLLNFYIERKENAKGLGIVDEALETYPDNPSLLKSKAMILADLGKLDAAADCMEKVLLLNPSADDARMFLGNYCFIKGEEFYDRATGFSGTDVPDSVSVADSDTADCRSMARILFLRAAEYLNPDSNGTVTPYVLNTVNIIRERLEALTDPAPAGPKQTARPK